ncbi:uncharacterized protein LOC130728249 [Lotus japonicus]|uniref:uncharacterized protein LOC130728249 n=1 Tax=Lotus japonicus TaxID=34305 RepID=UPI00258BF2A3|nr:uncharacterized protein LOC130728249 [Lotus japonicus]
MEESKAPEAAPPLSNPPPTTQTQTQIPSSTTRKRPLDSDVHSNYFKLRAVVRDLRPHFIQVLQTPDFKNCKASEEIRERLKIVIKLCDNMKTLDQKTLQEQQPQHVKSPEQLQVEKSFARQSEIKLTPPVPGSQKLQPDQDSQIHGTYVVGGSAFGWNFITFAGKEPVYYGRTKEQFRSARLTSSI